MLCSIIQFVGTLALSKLREQLGKHNSLKHNHPALVVPAFELAFNELDKSKSLNSKATLQSLFEVGSATGFCSREALSLMPRSVRFPKIFQNDKDRLYDQYEECTNRTLLWRGRVWRGTTSAFAMG